MLRNVVLLILAATVLAAGATAATPKRWYWSEEKAEALVISKVGIPYCMIETSDPKCANGIYRADGHPIIGRWRFADAICTGADEKGDTFTYSRFKCRFVVNYGYFRGRLAVYPTGRTTLRWTLLAVYDCRPGRCDSP